MCNYFCLGVLSKGTLNVMLWCFGTKEMYLNDDQHERVNNNHRQNGMGKASWAKRSIMKDMGEGTGNPYS